MKIKQTFECLGDARNSLRDAKLKTTNGEIEQELISLDKKVTELMEKAKDSDEINWED